MTNESVVLTTKPTVSSTGSKNVDLTTSVNKQPHPKSTVTKNKMPSEIKLSVNNNNNNANKIKSTKNDETERAPKEASEVAKKIASSLTSAGSSNSNSPRKLTSILDLEIKTNAAAVATEVTSILTNKKD